MASSTNNEFNPVPYNKISSDLEPKAKTESGQPTQRYTCTMGGKSCTITINDSILRKLSSEDIKQIFESVRDSKSTGPRTFDIQLKEGRIKGTFEINDAAELKENVAHVSRETFGHSIAGQESSYASAKSDNSTQPTRFPRAVGGMTPGMHSDERTWCAWLDGQLARDADPYVLQHLLDSEIPFKSNLLETARSSVELMVRSEPTENHLLDLILNGPKPITEDTKSEIAYRLSQLIAKEKLLRDTNGKEAAEAREAAKKIINALFRSSLLESVKSFSPAADRMISAFQARFTSIPNFTLPPVRPLPRNPAIPMSITPTVPRRPGALPVARPPTPEAVRRMDFEKSLKASLLTTTGSVSPLRGITLSGYVKLTSDWMRSKLAHEANPYALEYVREMYSEVVGFEEVLKQAFDCTQLMNTTEIERKINAEVSKKPSDPDRIAFLLSQLVVKANLLNSKAKLLTSPAEADQLRREANLAQEAASRAISTLKANNLFERVKTSSWDSNAVIGPFEKQALELERRIKLFDSLRLPAVGARHPDADVKSWMEREFKAHPANPFTCMALTEHLRSNPNPEISDRIRSELSRVDVPSNVKKINDLIYLLNFWRKTENRSLDKIATNIAYLISQLKLKALSHPIEASAIQSEVDNILATLASLDAPIYHSIIRSMDSPSPPTSPLFVLGDLAATFLKELTDRRR